MRLLPIAGALSAAALIAGCSSDSGAPASPSRTGQSQNTSQVQSDIDAAVKSGAVGAIVTLSDHGRDTVLTSGFGDLEARTPIPVDPPQHVRVGSITKSFTSAVVLQLVAEGKIRLDEPIETYLPGLLHGDGIDGRAITVRQILRHQSGIPNITDGHEVDEYQDALAGRTKTPEEEIAIALRHPAVFPPGTQYKYSNTNYIVAGMLIEKVTGAKYADELDRRILRPLGLRDTYLPPAGERDIRAPHPKGYDTQDGKQVDVSRIEPSVPWSAGALVTTGADLNRFYSALAAGQVVSAEQWLEMLDGVPTGSGTGQLYGLGVGIVQLPCGAKFIGHTGGIYGFTALSGATPEGRAVTYSFNSDSFPQPDVMSLLGHALCS
ncbi:serine hydrolase domain-containing protein [Nocardia arthritidis]|uniref:Serine hydrolase n=1 Tax=Nocardia arthritidis TaxID=228602 RepID=A0A6G9YSS0_9NOCA|nr:serine hydrolase [Nocardia arthritidis]QIS15933.1 serine hydrolase [Nocardia arthritidis]